MSLPVVLLEGQLTKVIYEAATAEISGFAATCPNSRCCLVVKSHGGDMLPSLDFVDRAKSLGMKFSTKIYEASSAAAFVALSLADEAEMSATTVLAFHLGEITIEVQDLSPDGQIPATMRDGLVRYDRALQELLKRLGVSTPKLNAELYGSGWLRIQAEKCLEYGIVQRLF